jgi:ATP-dependent exoDNAse (exonuclease V) alpha subunit
VNGSFAAIWELDQRKVRIEFGGGRELSMPLAQLRHVDYGYTSTSHAAQGATVDRVIVNMDTMRSDQLVNREQFYVSISHGRFDAQIYTNDKQALRNAVAREHQKEIALDAVKQQHHPTQVLQQQQSTGIGMHI